MKLGDIIRELLDDNDISQKDLANELNIPVSTLGNYIRNFREPDYETLKKIAEYFSVTTDYLLNHHYDLESSLQEKKLLLIFRLMTGMQKELFIEQGKAFIKYNVRMKKLNKTPK